MFHKKIKVIGLTWAFLVPFFINWCSELYQRLYLIILSAVISMNAGSYFYKSNILLYQEKLCLCMYVCVYVSVRVCIVLQFWGFD